MTLSMYAQLFCGAVLGWFIRGLFDITAPTLAFRYHEWKWRRKAEAAVETGVAAIVRNRNEEA